MLPAKAARPPRQHWSLLAQLSCLTIAVMLFSTLAYGLWYESRIARITRRATEEQAGLFVSSLATAAAPALVTHDSGALESLLVSLRNTPHLMQLAIFDGAGKPRAVVNIDADHRATLDFDLSPQSPPAQLGLSTQVSGEDEYGRIEAWAPIEVGHLLGWARVRFDRESEVAQRRLVRQQAIMSGVLTTALIVLALFLFLRSRLRPVAQCAVFAQRLAGHFGTSLTLPAHSREVELLQAALNDTSQRLHAQYQAIAERNDRLDAIFSLSPDGLVVFDKTQRLAYANAAFHALAPMDACEGMQLEAFEGGMASLCDVAEHYPRLNLAQAGQSADIELVRPQRRILRREHRVNDSGHLVLYFRDITAETEVARMKSEFLSTAAHELRTPMVSVFGFVELLLSRKYPEDAQRNMLEVIHRQSKLLINMVNELLDLARIEARAGKDFVLTVAPLRTVIEDTCAALVVPGDAHSLRLELPPETDLVEYDNAKLRQALANVLSNAYKYSPQGGEVSVTARYREGAQGEEIGITVRDAGLGMSPEQCAHAFERFYRADTSGNIPGTGLGLCLVKEIVELHHGQVELRSELGVGTTVTLWLPRAQAQSSAA